MGLMPSLWMLESSSEAVVLPAVARHGVAVGRLVRDTRADVSVDLGKGPQTITVRSLALTCNRTREARRPAMRPHMDTGRLALYQMLALYQIGHRTDWGMLWLLVSVSWAIGSQAGRSSGCAGMTIAGGERASSVNDGELLSLELPLHYRIHPKELTVLMPARHEPAEAETLPRR